MTQFDYEEWSRGFEEKMEDMRQRAEQASAAVADGDYTHSHRQGVVTVTVGASGNVINVRFGSRAEGLSGPQLSMAFMETYGEAVTEAARRLQAKLAEITGDTSELMEVLRVKVPLPEEDR